MEHLNHSLVLIICDSKESPVSTEPCEGHEVVTVGTWTMFGFWAESLLWR